MTKIPTAIYDNELDRFATRELKNPNSPTSIRQVNLTTYDHMVRIAEALLIVPRISFRVTGENVVAAILLRAFGADGLRRLLDHDAIEFLQEREMILFVESDELVHRDGVHPLAAGRHTNIEHTDPETSALIGLTKWSSGGLSAKELRGLSRKVASRTRPMSSDVAPSITKFTQEAYERTGS